MHLTIDEDILKVLKNRRINISKYVEKLILKDMALQQTNNQLPTANSQVCSILLGPICFRNGKSDSIKRISNINIILHYAENFCILHLLHLIDFQSV